MKVQLEQWRQATRIHGGLWNMMGAAVGVRLSRTPIPTRRLRRRVFEAVFGGKYPALNHAELEKPLDEFRSLNDLFTRGVRPGSRPVHDSPAGFVSPCDGRVQQVGRLDEDTLLTAKGTAYKLSSLVPGAAPDEFRNGCYAVLFLSPSDCHRIFSPADGQLIAITHVPGYRLLVHPPYQKTDFPVFTLNERVVLHLQTNSGPALLILVAGWGVGCITFPFEQACGMHSRRVTHWPLPAPRTIGAGDWLATFELGSTAILITAPSDSRIIAVQDDQAVQFGQSLFPDVASTTEDVVSLRSCDGVKSR